MRKIPRIYIYIYMYAFEDSTSRGSLFQKRGRESAFLRRKYISTARRPGKLLTPFSPPNMPLCHHSAPRDDDGSN